VREGIMAPIEAEWIAWVVHALVESTLRVRD
jgi:hypothetical protein